MLALPDRPGDEDDDDDGGGGDGDGGKGKGGRKRGGRRGAPPAEFVSFCRVGTGLTADQRASLRERLAPLLRAAGPGAPPPPACYRLTGRERADFWVADPFASVVVEVKGDVRVVPTNVYAAGYTLRFPRITRSRCAGGRGLCVLAICRLCCRCWWWSCALLQPVLPNNKKSQTHSNPTANGTTPNHQTTKQQL